MSIQNLPNSSHNDFIYMSEINSTFNSVAIAYQGDIIAQSEDNQTTQNFIDGYMAKDTLLNLKVTTISDSGIDQPIKTTQGTPVEFIRVIRFNSDSSVIVDKNVTFGDLPIINITKDKFEKDKNGTVFVDIRYNINKNLSETINPVKITFHQADANSTDAYSLIYGRDESNPYIPTGFQNLGDSVRYFYFAQVAPDRVRFPRIYFKETQVLRTPMQIEIFCGGSVNLTYCKDMNFTTHTKLESSPRASKGWFISIDHNASTDGGVIALVPDNPDPNIVQFKTATVPTMPIRFEHGRNGTLTTKFTHTTGTQKYRIDIFPDVQLRYYDDKVIKIGVPKGVPDYIVEGTDKNSSTWTGIGQTGRILDMKSNRKSSHKMDW
jgi:hypothetical protein